MVVALCLLCGAGGVGLFAAFHDSGQVSPELASMLPQGALLTIEARDFSGLLKRWNDSPQKAAWLKSDNYSVFSNSRLFGRLSTAQDEFATAAGLPPDASFLREVTGTESVFGWYDIGKLEFLYITRMPSGMADKTRLLQMRTKFSSRQIGSQTFYVHTHGDPEKGETPRTVAFAVSGDWLLLATREDLMAGALTLIANVDHQAATNSVIHEPWFQDAQTAAGSKQGEVRMTLNLEKIVPTPYFRSYWVQQNITEMKQFRSGVADVFLQADSFREERVLLPTSAPDAVATTVDLSQLTAMLPEHAGVFRAVAKPTVESAVASLNEKLLERTTSTYLDVRVTPPAELSVTEVDTASDLETRIDGAPMVDASKAEPSAALRLAALQQVLAGSDLQAMMTVSRTGEAGNGVWIPFQSAVVLASAKDWDASAMESALAQALGARLTTGGLGLQWKPAKAGGGSYFEIGDVRPLEISVKGKLCILTDDSGLMQEMLMPESNSNYLDSVRGAGHVTTLAGVDLASQRAGFARWSKLVDRTQQGVNVNVKTQSEGDGIRGEPAFFSRNIQSLSDVFATLETEGFVERRDGGLTRQTVSYTWRH